MSGHARVYGNAQICENAKVFGNARVYENAKVFGNAHIYGRAKVHEHSRIYENAEVYGQAEVYKHAHVFGSAKIYVNAKICESVNEVAKMPTHVINPHKSLKISQKTLNFNSSETSEIFELLEIDPCSKEDFLSELKKRKDEKLKILEILNK